MPRRRVARLSEIPAEARPLIDLLVDQRLLSTDVAADTGEKTIEPAHEALLRQWSLLQGWLAEDAGLLSVMDSVKRASRDWAANGRSAAWLAHTTGRLEAAERLQERPDLAANLEPTDRDYIAACRQAETAAGERERAARQNRQRMQVAVIILLFGVTVGLIGWINQAYLKDEWNWLATMRPYMVANVRPYVLTPQAERALQPLQSFRECAKDCPEMIVIPAGEFIMGSPATEPGRRDNEDFPHKVIIATPFAVSKFLVTFDDWDACVSVGGCPPVRDSGYGRGRRPVINVNADEAEQYAAWLSRLTGKRYRLLTEAEWEYAARGHTTTPYYWGDEVGQGNANCNGCNEQDYGKTAPVGSFKPNPFGLYDMAGNVWEWVLDCYHANYNGAPTDGSAWTSPDCPLRVARGGSWGQLPQGLRAATRFGSGIASASRSGSLGFRLVRELNQ
jgi:formylglycine-generating enzyme required for sulfatase activity